MDPMLIHRLADDMQSESVTNLREDLQTILAHSLKRIRRCARLKGTAAEKLRTALGYCFGDGEHLLRILDRTGTCDDREFATTDRRIPDLHDRALRTKVLRDQLVGL